MPGRLMLVSDPTVITTREIFPAKAVWVLDLLGTLIGLKKESTGTAAVPAGHSSELYRTCASELCGEGFWLAAVPPGHPSGDLADLPPRSGRKGQSRIGSAFPALTHGRKRKAVWLGFSNSPCLPVVSDGGFHSFCLCGGTLFQSLWLAQGNW